MTRKAFRVTGLFNKGGKKTFPMKFPPMRYNKYKKFLFTQRRNISELVQ